MKRQRALHLIFGATIALGSGGSDGDAIRCVAADRGGGGPSSSNNNNFGRSSSSSSSSSRPSFTRGSSRQTSTNRGGGGDGRQSSSARQRVEDILDLDDDRGGGFGDGSNSMMDDATSFLLDDDVDGFMDSLASNRGDIMDEFDKLGSGINNNNNAADGYSTTDGYDDGFDPLLDDDDSEENDVIGGGGGDGLMMGGSGGGGDSQQQDEYGQGSEKGALYDAYNLLHSLAQVSAMFLLFDCDVLMAWNVVMGCPLRMLMFYFISQTLHSIQNLFLQFSHFHWHHINIHNPASTHQSHQPLSLSINPINQNHIVIIIS